MAQQKQKKQSANKKANLKVVKAPAKRKKVSTNNRSKKAAKQADKSVSLGAGSKVKNEYSVFDIKEIMMNMNNTKNFEKMSQDVANAGKETLEACQKSATILAKNSQDCVSSYMSMMQSAADRQNKLMKEMLSKKTINEMSETLQSASQESFNEVMQNMSKLSEQSIKAVMDSYEPLNSQMNKIVKKASENAAA